MSNPSTGTHAGSAKSIREYYDHTWVDYRFVWLNRENLAVHFGYYDAEHRTHSAALENLNRVLADHVLVGPTDHVLDAGCGLGGSSIWLAKNRGATVIGIAPVKSQVTRARRAATEHGVADRVSFVCGDYADTSFPDGSFDVAWALESMCHARSKPAVYQELFRTLRPGGRLVIAEYMRQGRPLLDVQERLLSEWLTGWAIPDIDTEDEHRAAALGAGFTEVVIHDVTPNVRPSLRRLYALTYLGVPIDWVLSGLGLRNAPQNGNVKGARRQYEALRNDVWFYSIVTARRPS